MEIAKIRVEGIFANVVERRAIPSGLTGGTIRIEYAPGIWDKLSKTVVFRGVTEKDVLTQETVVEIPHETVAAPNKRLQVGFYGVNASGVQIIPTLWADLGLILPGADPSGDPSTDPSLPVWAQLQEDLRRLEELGGTDPETIGKLVEDYLQKNPPTGGVNFETDATLTLKDGILSVNTTNDMEQDNTLPITSAGVFATVGNIEALLKTI